MKIGFDCRYLRYDRHDGISRFTASLATALVPLCKKAGHELLFLISDERQKHWLPAEIPTAHISSPTSAKEPRVALKVNKYGCDVVYSPMQTMGTRGRKYTVVLTVHDLIYYKHPQPPREFNFFVRGLWRLYHLSWWPQRWLLNHADAIVTISATTARLITRHKLTKRPVSIVANAADLLPVQIGPTKKSLAYMGSFMPYKNVETIVRSLAHLPEYELHLLSKISPSERARLTRIASTNTVVFHDGVSDQKYADVLSSATALVTASRDEGFGIPVIEAMRAGIPVVVSDIDIFREIAGDAAKYFSPDSPEGLAAAVRQLEDVAVRADCIARGHTQAKKYDWGASAKALFDVLVETARAEQLGKGQ